MWVGKINTEEDLLIIAELSANHAGSKEVALDSIREAKKCGANAIKIQTYTPDTITIDSNKEYFQIGHGTLWDGRNLYDLYKEAFTPWEWHKEIFEVAAEEGLECFSSPFDKTAVDFLENLNTPAYKIASFEIQDIPLIEYAASKMKPIILSTGIASNEDVKLAIETCRKVGNTDIALLKCTSAYPAPVEQSNLRLMMKMGNEFNVEIGLSDHTLGELVPIVAVSMGARIIEKHFILDRKLGGPDADFSLDPEEFSRMVSSVKKADSALGNGKYELSDRVKKNKRFSRSLFIVEDVKKGELLTEQNIRSIRPGDGLHPKFYNEVLGREFRRDLERGTPLEFDQIQ